jgi:hypothetical protein
MCGSDATCRKSPRVAARWKAQDSGLVRRSAALIFVALAFVVGACAPRHANLPDDLPATIGGVTMDYVVQSGPEEARNGPPSIASGVADELGVSIDLVTYATGYRDNRGTFNSDFVQVRGVDTQQLLDAVIKVYKFTGERRIDTVGGKSVVRAVLPDSGMSLDEAPYFYAFDDVVIVVVGERPLIEEALRALP